MKVVHVLRKPLSGTVASNVTSHGCGGLNIAASRIGTEKREYKGSGVSHMRYTDGRAGLTDGRGRDQEYAVSGRWPANLIFNHLDGCCLEGTRKVKGQNPRYVTDGKGRPDHINVFNSYRPADVGIGHADADGTETIDNWVCVEGCPVKSVDEQSGIQKSPSTYKRGAAGFNASAYGEGVGQEEGTISLNYGDAGGASRYFKQVGKE